jgi:hypothetical protein
MFLGKGRVDAKRDRPVPMRNVKPLQQVSQINGPSAETQNPSQEVNVYSVGT